MMANIILIFFSLLAILSALGMLIFQNPMRVALSLVTVMLSLASIFALLENHVLALFQVLIYVGAIMVFMVYVIMLLDPHDQTLSKRFSRYALSGGLLLVLALIFFAPKIRLITPKQETINLTVTFQDFAQIFLKDYFLYFELTSVVLVIGVVGAVAIIKGRNNALN